MRPLRHVARALLWVGGWTPVGELPDVPKAVIIGAPHTSNWDAVWALAYKVLIGLEIRFFAKHSLFWFPLGNLLRAFGAIPLDRKVPGSAVSHAVKSFGTQDSFYFALAPEGTRRWRPYWKTGFYRIAADAGVPIVLGYFDYANKRVGLGPTIELTGDRESDLARVRDFYSDIRGCKPENAGPIAFPDDAR